MDNTQQLLLEFKSLKNLTMDKKLELKNKSDNAYYNGQEIISDQVYDSLVEELKSNGYFDDSVGYTPSTGKVTLPLWMGSLNKVYNDKEIKNWNKKVTGKDFLIQSKLDGVSCLVIHKRLKNIHLNGVSGRTSSMNGCTPKNVGKRDIYEAYTRGNGSEGTNITYLLPYLLNGGCNMGNGEGDIVGALRCEIMVKKDLFKEKYAGNFSNPRSFVSGVVNRKKDNMVVSEIKDLCLVAYEYINYENGKLSNSQYEVSRQISLLTKYAPLGIDTVRSQPITVDQITQHFLTDTLKTFREESYFEMDGLVIIADVQYVRTTEGNPKHAIAFKTRGEDNVKEAHVTFVEWNVGKTGVFAPKVHIHPTEINGTTVSCFTGFNANYLMEKGIGEGAIILVTRVGDAIPQIIGVRKTGTLNFPKNYEWKGRCRIVEKITKVTSKERAIKQILNFVERVKIPYIKEATIVKLYDNGCTNIKQFLKLTQKDLLMFGPKLSGTIYSNIQKSFEAPIEKVLSGFSAFGDYIGEKKIILLFKAYPRLFENDDLNNIDLLKIRGFGSKTVEQIKENFNYAKSVYVDITTNYPYKKYNKEKKDENNGHMEQMNRNIIVCVSGTRDPLFIKELKDRNITLADSVTRKVHMLLVKTNDSQTSKVKKALELGTPIVTIEQFKVKYFL